MTTLKQFIHGMGSVLEISPLARTYHVESEGSRKDYQRLRADFVLIGRDLDLAVRLAANPSVKTEKGLVATKNSTPRRFRGKTLRKRIASRG